MKRTRHRRTLPRRLPARRRASHGALAFLGVAASVIAWLLEQTDNVLLLALGAGMTQYVSCLGGPAPHTSVTPAWHQRLPHLTIGAFRWLVWRFVITLLGGLSVQGPRPAQPCVIVANHRSHADTAALLASLPFRRTPRVAAAADYWFERRWRRRLLCRWLAAGIPVRRTGNGYADLTRTIALLHTGRIIVIFPEGTRSEQPGLATFHNGAFALARAAGVPVLPVALTGTEAVLTKNTRRLHRARIRVHYGQPMWHAGPQEARACIEALLRT